MVWIIQIASTGPHRCRAIGDIITRNLAPKTTAYNGALHSAYEHFYVVDTRAPMTGPLGAVVLTAHLPLFGDLILIELGKDRSGDRK